MARASPITNAVLPAVARFLVLLSPLAFARGLEDCFGLPKRTLLGVAAACLLPAVVARVANRASWRRLAAAPWVGLPALWLLVTLAVTLLAGNLPAAAPHVLLLVALAVVFGDAASAPLTSADRRRLAIVVVAVAALEAGYALAQWQGVDPLFGAATRDAAAPGWPPRLIGTLGYPNTLGAMLALGLPVAAWGLLTAREGTPRRGWWWTAAIVLVVAALVVTRSRGAWGAAVAGLVVLGLVLGPRRLAPHRRLLAALALALSGVVGAAAFATRAEGESSVCRRFTSQWDLRAPALLQRQLTWRATLDMVRERPVSGHGLGSVALQLLDRSGAVLARPEHANLRAAVVNVKESHNDYLQMAAESGLVGLALWAGCIVCALTVLVRRARARSGDRPEEGRAWAAAGAGVMTAFAALACVSFPLHELPVAPLAAMLIGLGLNPHPDGAAGRADQRIADAPRWTAWLGAVMGAAAIVWAAIAWTADRAFAEARRETARGHFVQALAHYDQAVRLAPWNGRLRFFHGACLLATGAHTEAQREFSQSAATFSDLNLWRNAARAATASGDGATAVSLLRRAAATGLYPDAVRRELAEALAREGQTREAVRVLCTTEGFRNESEMACCHLARHLLENGQAAAAVTLLQTLALGPRSDAEERAAVQAMLGVCLDAQVNTPRGP